MAFSTIKELMGIINIMKTMKYIAAAIASVMITVNANAENKNVKVAEATNVVNVAKSNVRTMVTSADDGTSYKIDYILNDNGKVVNKVTSAWDTERDEWAPVSAYSVVYTPTETILSYAKYNPYSKTYSKDVRQARFNATEYPELIRVPECCK